MKSQFQFLFSIVTEPADKGDTWYQAVIVPTIVAESGRAWAWERYRLIGPGGDRRDRRHRGGTGTGRDGIEPCADS